MAVEYGRVVGVYVGGVIWSKKVCNNSMWQLLNKIKYLFKKNEPIGHIAINRRWGEKSALLEEILRGIVRRRGGIKWRGIY